MVNIFSYGSNSLSQLNARVLNPSLIAVPAVARDWSRVFCMESFGWKGGVASLAPCVGCSTYGSLSQLNEVELRLLDSYESSYNKIEITVLALFDESWVEVPAFTYLSKDYTWFSPPSEQYLTAISLMLREQYSNINPEHSQSIDVCSYSKAKNSIEKIFTWTYPGVKQLSLEALCVEVNALREVKWIMPRSILEFVNNLNSHNVYDIVQLKQWILRKKEVPRHNELNLIDTGVSNVEVFLDLDSINILTKLLLIESLLIEEVKV
jgi:hypothetical protein